MPTLTITDVDGVRSEGSLKDPSDSAGAASDRQIKRAILDARRRMIVRLSYFTPPVNFTTPGVETDGTIVYAAVQAYSSADLLDPVKGPQFDAFQHAESCLAIAELFARMNVAQLAATGLLQSKEIGKSRQTFASSEEVKQLSAGWAVRAYRWLGPYLAVPADPISLQQTSFTSRKGTLYMGAI